MSRTQTHRFAGTLVAPTNTKIAIVAARFNSFIVEQLVEGATDGLERHGVLAEHITIAHVPGAWEIPAVCQRFCRSGKFDAVIALGCVIRGATPHFEYVAGEVASGCAAAMRESRVPVIFGVLTTESIEQAIERAGTKAGNKGFDAALAAIEMINLGKQLEQHGY